jgi:hypothetical protein
MTNANKKQEFLECLQTTKKIGSARLITDVEVWRYYDWRWDDSEFAAKCDNILGYKDKLISKNVLKEALNGNADAMMIMCHSFYHNDLFEMLYFDYNILPSSINNTRDLLAAHNKVIRLYDEGKLSQNDLEVILEDLDKRKKEIMANSTLD